MTVPDGSPEAPQPPAVEAGRERVGTLPDWRGMTGPSIKASAASSGEDGSPRGMGREEHALPLAGWRVLVVEDEALIALDVELALEDAGARVLGPARDERRALALIEGATAEGGMDAAVLDVDLGDHSCEGIAARLRAEGVPFVLHTGDWRAEGELVEALGAPVVAKPSSMEAIVRAVAALPPRRPRAG